MLEIFLQCLHIIPFAIIALVVTAYVSKKSVASKIGSDAYMAILLILASIGLGAGHFIHESGFAHIEAFDPCYAYVATLLGVVFKLVKGHISAVAKQ